VITPAITIAIRIYMMGRNDLSNWIRNTASRTADPVMLAATVAKNMINNSKTGRRSSELILINVIR
jgi:hypothetical protein